VTGFKPVGLLGIGLITGGVWWLAGGGYALIALGSFFVLDALT